MVVNLLANLLILKEFDNTSTTIGNDLLDKFLVSFLMASIISPASSNFSLDTRIVFAYLPFVNECKSVRTTVGKSSSSTIFRADTVNRNTSVCKTQLEGTN